MSRRSSTGSSKRPQAARSEAKPSEVTTRKRPQAARSEAKPSEGTTARPRGRRRPSHARVLHLDCFSGISGNMFLGAALDAGLSRAALKRDLEGLGVPHRLVVRKVRRGPLAALYVDVRVPREAAKQTVHRNLAGITGLLRGAKLAASVRDRAIATFERLAEAEAKVHGSRVDAIHFHEVGAVDAIVDITGAAIALEHLGVDRVTASPAALGSPGTVETEHGTLPLPAPATLELLRGIPVVPAHVAWETVTPTGAALLAQLVDDFGPLPAMQVEAVGHGAGNDRKGPLPNVLRVVLGRAGAAGADRVAVLETHIDDLVPEHFDHLMQRLFDAGALDVSLQSIQMKKNRPGFLVRVLGRPSERMALARTLFAESTAIGVRASESDRIVLQREIVRVETPYGRLRVKRVEGLDGEVAFSPEYDDCTRAARRTGARLRDVVRAAEEAARAGD